MLNLSSQVAAANALSYVTPPFAQGFTVEDYRRLYREHACRVRWWKALPLESLSESPTGRAYIEQTLGDEVRAFIFANELDQNSLEFGSTRIGDVRFSSIPDEIELAIYDRILALDNPRTANFKFVPSGDVADQLPRLYPASIDTVATALGVLEASRYSLIGRNIVWNGEPPEGEIAVRYKFYPQYEFRGEDDKQAFIASDGGRMPQIVPLQLLAEREENE